MNNSWQSELKKNLKEVYTHRPDEWVDFNVSTLGQVNLTIVSDELTGMSMSHRRDQINRIVNKFSVSPGFLSLYTVQEALSLQLSPPQPIQEKGVYTWQDLALWAANPQDHIQSVSEESRIPRTVTFYSFKGGVGRTTALTHVAWILAKRGRKVVAVDLDLEAPGLSTALNLNPKPDHGIVDYFYDRAYLPEGIEPTISITQIFGEVVIPDSPGRLFVVPAGILNLDYISKVDDLRATTVLSDGSTLWDSFSNEIKEHLNPDVILVDSRTGINEWGALSLLQAADEAIVFLFPNEQNYEGINLLLKSLSSFGSLSVNFVFSPVPDPSAAGMARVNKIWQLLNGKNRDEFSEEEVEQGSDLDDFQNEITEPLVVPYLQTIAMADQYPVVSLLDYYTRIANLIDGDTQQIRLKEIIKTDGRWGLIESLQFPALNAAEPSQNLSNLFQRTANFEKFLDETTCLIKGRKGTGKTALYSLLLKYQSVAKKLAHGRLDNVIFLSGHGGFHETRPSRTEFQIINQRLQEENGSWESFWRAYLILRVSQNKYLKFLSLLQGEKFKSLVEILRSLSGESWQSEYTQALVQLSTNRELRLIIPDALDLLNNKQRAESLTLWFLYDDLDEDFPNQDGVRKNALTGLFQLIQACDARRLTSIRFKIFLREDIWSQLNFDNKSHFNGRDLLLQWTRIDFLRLALRQAIQSPEFKDLIDRSSPVESIDQANEEILDRALELLWGSRRRRGTKAKYVSRWIYERLTDTSGITFPRSLSVLLQGAKEQELTYKGQSAVQPPTDRLLRAKSLEIGLEKASDERCDAIRQEYPELENFFNALEGVQALPLKEDLCKVWTDTAQDVLPTFDEFSDLLSKIGVAKWREKDKRYGFPDIYVYGFKMIRAGTK